MNFTLSVPTCAPYVKNALNVLNLEVLAFSKKSAKHMAFFSEMLRQVLKIFSTCSNYSLSHKVEISERSKSAKNVQLSINVVI